MNRLERYEKLVSPDWVHSLIRETDRDSYRVVEVSWRTVRQYRQAHIPGAVHMDTEEIESEPLWNIASANQLEAVLLSLGITSETLVVMYGRDPMAAARAACVMMYAGVSDVRFLNGGFQAWIHAGLPVESGEVPRRPKSTFGARLPLHPEWIIGTDEARSVLADPDGRLVSIRSWPEFIGNTSGYSYIRRKGRIQGSVWGYAGSDRNHMEDFRNRDNTMRDLRQIAENWRRSGIDPHHRISFYCGTGWRASEAFFAAYLLGYPNISVYDGGWYEWSAVSTNSVAMGEPKTESSFPCLAEFRPTDRSLSRR